MVDQGSSAKIMYLDLYRGLNLKSKDLTAYESPLVSFDRKVVIPKDQIRLPVQVGSEVVEMDFIVVDVYSPYTAIVARSLTQLPLRSLLRSTNYMGRIVKWGTILGAFYIKHMPRTSVKGQILADLVAKFAKTPLEEKVKEKNMDEKSISAISIQKPLS
nr:hypothetical protein CFP56_02228 [Quercus suber]